ncbi:MAG: transcription termination/antitermination protein NusA [Candidatus Portnoybacteria bacterium]|nr:transcription termination/antitermination protein NusA [Candidatus Portnoybacteria bacterium]
MDKEFISAIEQICEERGIAKERVLETIEMAIAAAYKKEHGRKGQIIRAEIDLETGEAKIFQVKLVVDETMLKPEKEGGEEETLTEEEVASEATKDREEEMRGEDEDKKIRFNPEKHIMVDEAKKTKKGVKVGDELLIPLEPSAGYGRIAAQTAKQVIVQRIREAEKEAVFEEFRGKEGQIISGVVQRMERGNIFFDLGRGNGVLTKEEQIFGEYYRPGQRFRLYVFEVRMAPQGSMILLSRVHPAMISRLFEIEVPEVAAGTVVIKSVAREAGSRSKIAAVSTDEKIDPIGSLVGQKGTRVQAVINELGGEKIDIIQWDEDPAKFIANALSPAKAIDVDIKKRERRAVVKVPEDQLSLAIGKKGQNVRLAAKLTGWKIDILSAKGEKIDAEEGEKEEGGEEKVNDAEIEKDTAAEREKKEQKDKTEEKEEKPKKKRAATKEPKKAKEKKEEKGEN